MSAEESPRRSLRSRFEPRLLLLLLILPIAFFVARSQSHSHPVTQANAVDIARQQINYIPDGTSVRYIHQGLPPQPFWAVSLWQEKPTGERFNVTVVVIDASSGKVTQISRNVAP